jgi:ribosomal protein S27E
MKIVKTDPALRFETTGLCDDVMPCDAGWESGPLYTKYVCPECKDGVVFTKSDLYAACDQATTTLEPSIASQFDSFAESAGIKVKGFLDWVCPTCRMACRIYLHAWAGGRHGAGGVDIVALLEGR